jgi:hypothetical protein
VELEQVERVREAYNLDGLSAVMRFLCAKECRELDRERKWKK